MICNMKKIWYLVLAMSLVSFVPSCGDDDDDDEKTEKNEEKKNDDNQGSEDKNSEDGEEDANILIDLSNVTSFEVGKSYEFDAISEKEIISAKLINPQGVELYMGIEILEDWNSSSKKTQLRLNKITLSGDYTVVLSTESGSTSKKITIKEAE